MLLPILIILAVLAIAYTVYANFFRKEHCPQCNKPNVILTGKRVYKEDPVCVAGQPESYYEYEHKCKDCGYIYWKMRRSLLFN